MTLILLVAAALRLGALPQLPLGLHYDEAANVILSQQIAAGERRPLFIRAYTGKEILFFYAAAPWMWMTGNAAWGLRLGAAMLGLLTVAASYAAAYAMLGEEEQGPWLAVASAGWVSVLFPHVLLSRYGFRAISQPLLQALTLATLWRGLRLNRRSWLIVSGICLGLSAYTYLAVRLFPIPLGLALGWLLIQSPGTQRAARLRQIAWVLLIALITFAPLGIYFLQHPDAFMTRIAQVASPTWRDALHGMWRCVQALVWPGAGDPYVRFNIPGRPVLDGVTAIFALIGSLSLLLVPCRTALTRASRCLLFASLGIMLLPSALATSEITPSHLRMVGLFPFVAMFPALGLIRVLRWLPAGRWKSWVCVALFLAEAMVTVFAYRGWATSPELFYAADGEMVLAARVLDAADLSHTTAYIVSQHYRHPTVAALARRYPQAKWLTGGATWVLPPQGNALYLLPDTVAPPSTWPHSLRHVGSQRGYLDPRGEIALRAHHVTENTLTALRPTQAVADFAHIVLVYDAYPITPCRVAEVCTFQITWEAAAPYPALEPVARLVHPQTGEWARVQAFHYPPEQWTIGDVVLDHLTLIPPVGMPPGQGYQLSVGFYNPETGEALSRLQEEHFAGLEVRFPETQSGFEIGEMDQGMTPALAARACPSIPQYAPVNFDNLQLLGWTSPPETARPGETFMLKICWQVANPYKVAYVEDGLALYLAGENRRDLYTGNLVEGKLSTLTQPDTILEGRYQLRIPKDTEAGAYRLDLMVPHTSVPAVMLGRTHVTVLTRTFSAPAISHTSNADFGEQIRLLGYDVVGHIQAGQTLEVRLYWQSLQDVEIDYTVFVHLLDAANGQLFAQIDEAPRNNTYPTSLWMEGEIVVDPHILTLPDSLPQGPYALRVGFYVPEIGAYLAVNAGERALMLEIP